MWCVMGKSRNLEAENQAWCFCSVYLLGDSGGRAKGGMGLKTQIFSFLKNKDDTTNNANALGNSYKNIIHVNLCKITTSCIAVSASVK